MKVTNNFSMPEPFWRACAQQRSRQPNRISVTELLRPPQMAFLLQEHERDLEVDCSDMLELFFGNAVHFYLEQFAPGSADAETRIEWTDPETGWTVHGTPDLHEMFEWKDGRLTDWKTTRVRALQYDREEWKAQVNLYAHLLRLTGKRVDAAVAWVFCKDFDPQKRGKEDGYPRHGIVQIPVELWSETQAADFLGRRLRLHEAASKGMYGPCTDAERWKRDTWAVMPKDGKRAKAAGFATKDEAQDYAAAASPELGHYSKWFELEKREGEPVRCMAWCPASSVCKQWEAERPDTLAEQLEGSIRKLEARA